MLDRASSPFPLLEISNLNDFDTVSAEDLEASRQLLGLTPPEFAESLGWSLRKYQRTLEATREKGFADRDTALAIRGLAHVLLGSEEEDAAIGTGIMEVPLRDDGRFLKGRVFPHILEDVAATSGEWTAQVTPHLLELVAKRAIQGKPITYGEAATTLEERDLTRRVWPRTLYGMPLGAICRALLALSKETGERIPLLSVIVVRASGEPGTGIDNFLKDFLTLHEPKAEHRKLLVRLKKDRAGLVKEMQEEVFAYPNWPGVFRALKGSVR